MSGSLEKLGLGRSSSDFSRDVTSPMSGLSSGFASPSSGYTTPQAARRNGAPRYNATNAQNERYVDALAEIKTILNPQGVSFLTETLPEIDYCVDLDWDSLGDLSLEEVARGGDNDFVVSDKPDSETIERKKAGLEVLRAQLKESDEALKQLEDYLTWFQKDLGTLSADMELLQGKSLAISERLSKRVDVEKILAPQIEEMIIPGHISQTIFEGDMDDNWIKCVQEFDATVEAKAAKSEATAESVAKAEQTMSEQTGNKAVSSEGEANVGGSETSVISTTGKDTSSPLAAPEITITGPSGESDGARVASAAPASIKLNPISKASQFQSRLLKDKIIERSRDFFVLKIKQIRLPGASVQQIQREMLENKYLYIYLEHHYPELAVALKKAYVNTIRWYYFSHFSRYITCLDKLKLKHVDKSILLGSEESTSSSGLLGMYGSSAPRDPSVATSQELMHSTAKRIRQLEEEESTVMPAKIAENNPIYHWIETGFRSLMQALLDNCKVEYDFLSELFGSRHASGAADAAPHNTVSRIDKLFQKIFIPTFEAVSNYANKLTETTFDGIGMLICIRICQKMASLCHGVPVLRAVYKRLAMQLWPRLQIVLDANCESLRRAASKPSSFVSANNSANPNMAAFAPIQLTQEWANFEAAILTLSTHSKAVKEPVSQCLNRLQSEYESFLTKVSACLGSSKTKGIQQRRETFLYNNYFLVSTIISDIEGDLAQQQKQHLHQLLEAYKQ